MNIPEIKIKVDFKNKEEGKLFKVKKSDSIFELSKELFDNDKICWVEESILLCMNNANDVIGFYKLSSGGTCSTILDAKVIYTVALNSIASSIIIVHNHPSGNITPSDADKRLTRQIKNAGELLNIKLLDSMIITRDYYYSFADEGEL
jgi:DNA repair protein RadC